jgi:phage tail protein X
MKLIIAKDGDMLDSIVFNHYGRHDVLPKVLLANRHLAKSPIVLQAGTFVALPDIPPTPEKPVVRLWT